MVLGHCQVPGRPPQPMLAAPSPPHQGFISGEGCAPTWSRQLSSGSGSGLGVPDGYG